jgi:hypothetical protein
MNLHSRRSFLGACALAAFGGRSRSAETPHAVAAEAITKGPNCHFFGYYDKCPWDVSGRYVLAQQIGFCDRQPETGEELTIGMVDRQNKNEFIPLDKTTAWCWQQGTMLQWLGGEAKTTIAYNSVRDKQYVALLRDVKGGEPRVLPRPIYALSTDGTQAVSLPFDRLHRLRPGYGYCALSEKFPNDPAPEKDGVWWMDVETGKNNLVVPIAKLAANKPDERFRGTLHWVNHLQFNPSGTRFLFLHRWKLLEKPWWTRLYTCKPDGSDLRLIIDDGMVSHFDWRDDDTILAWARTKKDGDHFYLFDINGGQPKVVSPDTLTRDGHCSYSPDRRWILNDTYPDAKRMQTLMLYDPKTGRRIDLNQFYLAAKLTGPMRCDLHPRWNRDGTEVCVDSAHIGDQRQMYVLNVKEFTAKG